MTQEELQELKKSAEDGNAAAQAELGYKYCYGIDVEKDYTAAVEWLTKSANQGNAEGQYYLGYCYDCRHGVARDYNMAFKLYQSAAEQGHAEAQESLGSMYRFGSGVEENTLKAIEWYKKALNQYIDAALSEHKDEKKKAESEKKLYNVHENIKYTYETLAKEYINKYHYEKHLEQSEVDLICELADFYYTGIWSCQDYKKAYSWYRSAAEKGSLRAKDKVEGREYYERGYSNYKDGKGQNYKEAVKCFEKAAELGDASGQRMLADCYFYGNGTPVDYEKAAKWYIKAAEQMEKTAIYRAADCYYNGTGVEKNYEKAVRLYSISACECSPYGYYGYLGLGNCFFYGRGVERDYVLAAKYYNSATFYDKSEAYCRMGYCHEHGYGVKQDYFEAYSCYNEAACMRNEEGKSLRGDLIKKIDEQGDVELQYRLGCSYREGSDAGAEWFLKAAAKGHAKAQYYLGGYYSLKKNYEEAAKWYRKAVEQGVAAAANELADLYMEGKCDPEDAAEAAELYRANAERGDNVAQNKLGELYYEGKSLPQDYEKAAEWFKKSAEQGNRFAQWNLGDCYYFGHGVPQDHMEALKWYHKANKNDYVKDYDRYYECCFEGDKVGDAEARYQIGLMYHRKKEYGKAISWFGSANTPDALGRIGDCYNYGWGVREDSDMAKNYYLRARERAQKLAEKAEKEKKENND